MANEQTAIHRIIAAWPLILAAVSVTAIASVAQFQIAAHAEDLKDHDAEISRNSDDIEAIQRTLIKRQGEIALQVQQIQNDQKRQSDSIKDVLDILKDMQRRQD